MASTLQVILQQDLKNLGKTGDVVKVRPGYARNFLIPRALATLATERHLRSLTHEKAVAAARNEKLKAEAVAVAKQIGETPIVVGRKVGEGDRLYGAVSAKEIETALAAKGVVIDRRKLELAEPIRLLGNFEIPIKLGYDVVATVKLQVVAGQ